jgi:PKD repeat protein
MKKIVLLLVAIMATSLLFAQVQRNKVIVEIATGTWCTYCPGAAIAADNLVASGANVATIEYHNNDAFTNAASNARNTYYAVPGYPTAHFDGPTNYVGGVACPGGGLSYTSYYNTCYAVQSPVTIDISGTNTGNTYNLVLSVHKVSAISGTDLRLHVVLTETNIACSPWPGSGCMTEVDFVERLMAPNENGTNLSFTSGDMQIVLVSFTKDASWVNSNCSVIAFVQDNPTKTIFNGSMVPLNSIPLPIPVNFTSNTTTGCAPVTVNYTDQSTGCNNWQWDFPGGTPSSATTQNPTTTYNTTGTYDATLTAWSNTTFRGNKMVKPGYIIMSSLPDVPGTPTGMNQLCSDPANQTYNSSGSANATSYTWDIQPTSAGTLSPSGSSCTVDFNNTYTGTCSLKVKGTNSCGDGPWSTPLSITVSAQPGVPGTPTGPALLCLNPPNTDYTTSGTSPATSYAWQINPSTAGTISGTWTTGTVDWAPTYVGTAQIGVQAINGGCTGPVSAFLMVNVDNGPGVYTMTGGGATCATGSGIAVGLDGSQTGINYTLFMNGSATSNVVPGTGAPISFGNQTVAGNYSAEALNPATTCSNPMNGLVVVTVDPQVPDAPAQPTGEAAPLEGSTTDYTTTGGAYAASYSWAVTPASAGSVTGNSTTGSVTWNIFTGSPSVKVQGINTCGAGSWSTEFPVNVLTGIGDSKMQKLVTLYPNPAKGTIKITPLYRMTTDLKVYNTLGSVVIEKDHLTLDGAYQMDISNLVPGIYYFNIITNDTKQIQKVVVE